MTAIKWIFMVAGVAAVVMLYRWGHQYVMFASFGVLFLNFASFCLQYEDPAKRALARRDERLLHMKPGARNSEEVQSAQSSAPPILPQDRAFRWDVVTLINIVTGIAALGLCGYGVLLYVSQ